MPTIRNRRPAKCPLCGATAMLDTHDHYVEESATPVSQTRELSCPNGCQPTEEQLRGL